MIEVLKSGLQLSIQDLGRDGFRHLGISKAGSLDPYAHIIANRLLNNDDNAAVLEITLGLCELKFHCDTVIALFGADLQATINNVAIFPGWTYAIKNNHILRFGIGRAGLRAYLAVKHGIQNESIMGSKSTDINSGFGGLVGRALDAGDKVPIAPYSGIHRPKGAITPPKRRRIRVHPSPHVHILGQRLLKDFESTLFNVSHQSNRMGIRLENKQSLLTHTHSLPSFGVGLGSIQLPPNGEPIVLLNDGQTTGGYPLLGTVIEADIHQFAQFKSQDTIEFEYVNLTQAKHAKQKLDAHLNQISIALKNENNFKSG